MWMVSRKQVRIGLGLLTLLALIFGSTFIHREPDINVLSYGVAGRVIVIDPGHGGHDPGTIGRQTKIPEKDVDLAIAKRLAKLLSQAGAMVVMTRTDDKDLSDEGFKGPLIERKRQDLGRRVALAHRLNADLFISVHANADPSPRWHGAQTFYYANNKTSHDVAVAIQGEMVRILGNNNRKAKEGVFYVIEKTKMPSVTVEVGFLSNPEEEKLLSDDLHQSKVAYSIFSGIVKHYAKEEWP
ncbi:MAG: N-acetylmuramoyl-L-alanine amidase family protein [Chitinophagales bacterium]